MRSSQKTIFWFAATLFLVWCMVMLGGATRLTHAGLSITEWKPITGAIPPLSEIDWLQEFHKYQLTPEFKLINSAMVLGDFKFIYLMEYFHRLLGRLMGIVFLIPLLFLWKQLPKNLQKLSVSVLVLGALQGLMGWYMVKSGLKNDPFVSPYRLTAHLFLALALMGMLTYGLAQTLNIKRQSHPKIRLFYITIGFVIATIFYGGLVAGHKAGLIYNTFPLMNGMVIPGEFLQYSPWWTNFLSNHATIQWMHRTLAIITFIHVILFHLKDKTKASSVWLILVSIQFVLGIATLVHNVPVVLGVLHQGMGALLFSWSIFMVCLYKKGHIGDKVNKPTLGF